MVANSPRSICENSNMTPRLSVHVSIFALVFFVWELRDNGVLKSCDFDHTASESC